MTEVASSSNQLNAPSSPNDVKLKLFDLIGIASKAPPIPSISKKDSTNWIHPRTQSVKMSKENLKYDKQANCAQPQRKRENESPRKGVKKQKKRLSFNEEVKVVPIPMRYEYSKRDKSRLWSSAIEIQENAARNTIEYASEGWDWRSVLEDDRMHVCVATSELIHPCHYEQHHRHGFR